MKNDKQLTHRAKGATEKKNMRLWPVACVMIPSTTLLNADAAPLTL